MDQEAFSAYVEERRPQFLLSYTGTQITSALARAKDYITARYLGNLRPGYDINSDRVVKAIYETAIVELIEPLSLFRFYSASDAKVLVEAEGLKWKVFDQGPQPVLPLVEYYLNPILRNPEERGYAIRTVGGRTSV